MSVTSPIIINDSDDLFNSLPIISVSHLSNDNAKNKDSKYEAKWINVRKRKEVLTSWRGIDRRDGKYRLYKRIPSYCPGKMRNKSLRGRLMNSFTKFKLIKIAWKIGVANPDSFDSNDAKLFNLTDEEGFKHFAEGWNNSNKDDIMNYIWNHLYDADAISVI
jgi:hypothetical protein